MHDSGHAAAFVSSFCARSPIPASRELVARNQLSTCRRRRNRSLARRLAIQASLNALLFDCDGVLADTERDAHRVAFNMAFSEKGINDVWDEPLYGKLLETGGGKERMTARWNDVGWPSEYASTEARAALVQQLHARKTELFMQLVASGKVPLRPGVQRLVDEAFDAGVPVAVCSTSNERAVAEIVAQLGGERASKIRIFAGDVVEKKKPAPDIYLLAAKDLNLTPSQVCVVEDSFIGLKAAKSAGMRCIITKSSYTQNEDFDDADRVVDSLENPHVSMEDLSKLVDAET